MSSSPSPSADASPPAPHPGPSPVVVAAAAAAAAAETELFPAPPLGAATAAAAAVSTGSDQSPYAQLKPPPIVMDEEGNATFPNEYKVFNWETITLEDIVLSIVPSKTFKGSCVAATDELNLSDALAQSVFEAENLLQKRLDPFGIQLATIPTGAESNMTRLKSSDPALAEKFPSIVGNRTSINKNNPSRPMRYYCKRCLELKGIRSKDPSQMCMALVVVARLKDACFDTKGRDSQQAQAVLTIEKLFPHDVACSQGSGLQKPSHYLNEAKGGSGSLVVDFPYDLIYGPTMSALMAKVSSCSTTNGVLPVGKQISPQTYDEKVTVYPFDNRGYEPLPSTNPWIKEVLCPVEFRYATISFWFWVACHFSLSAEMYGLQFQPFQGGGSKKTTVYPTWPCPKEPPKPHLRIKGVAGLWAGHQKGEELVDQIFHVDIREVKVVDEEGLKEVTISENPYLKSRFKPGIFVIPSQDYRDICFIRDCQKVVVRSTKGEVMYFGGDVAHGGKTYPPDDPSWHFSVHLYMDSEYHPMLQDTFGLVNEANALYGQQHTRYLKPAYVEEIKAVILAAMKKLGIGNGNHEKNPKRKKSQKTK